MITSLISFTNEALSQVKYLINCDPESEKILGLRIAIQAGGCAGYSYKMEFIKSPPNDQDKIFDFNGFTVVVDSRSFLFMQGLEVDYNGGLNGQGFIYNNPNAARGCGCGTSFSV